MDTGSGLAVIDAATTAGIANLAFADMKAVRFTVTPDLLIDEREIDNVAYICARFVGAPRLIRVAGASGSTDLQPPAAQQLG